MLCAADVLFALHVLSYRRNSLPRSDSSFLHNHVEFAFWNTLVFHPTLVSLAPFVERIPFWCGYSFSAFLFSSALPFFTSRNQQKLSSDSTLGYLGFTYQITYSPSYVLPHFPILISLSSLPLFYSLLYPPLHLVNSYRYSPGTNAYQKVLKAAVNVKDLLIFYE